MPLQILVQALVTENFELSRRATKESVKVWGTRFGYSQCISHHYVINAGRLINGAQVNGCAINVLSLRHHYVICHVMRL
jgi:hypothetical protein